MFVSLIFPCRNEERAIPQLLPAALFAKKKLLKESAPIQDIEIVVVDDGSIDRSSALLRQYEKDIKIITLDKPKGYGAALKEGIRQAQGDWIAFCDLDGTCLPEELAFLARQASQKSQALVWGSRLHKNSAMPFLRRLGNRLYQAAFWLVSGQFVPDPCSGFRLFKKSALARDLGQFPDDLSFSLALSAYCVRQKLSFSAINISYQKRLGESKLRPFEDGFRFLRVLIVFLFLKKFKDYTDRV